MSDYTKVWEALNSKHVLLLVDTHVDPSLPNSGGYDVEAFEKKLQEIDAWFSPIVKSRAGMTDFLLINGAWLCVRPKIPMPVLPQKQNLTIMVLE